MRCFILLCILLAYASAAFSQPGQLKFDHLLVEHGLSNFTPTVIAQDKQGFLWIGTEDGLNKYDGYTFRIYRPKPGDSTSLDGGIIVGLLCDRDGDVWVTSQGDGVFRYDAVRDAFEKFRIPSDSGNISMLAGALMQTPDGLMWVMTNDGAFVFDKQTRAMQRVLHSSLYPRIPTNRMVTCAADSNGMIWAGTSEGLIRFDPHANAVKVYPLGPPAFQRAEYRSVSSVAVDPRGTIWVATIGGLLRYDRATDVFEPVRNILKNGNPLGRIFALTLYVDRSGILCVGTMGDGLVRLDPVRNTLEQYISEPAHPYSLLNDRITTMFEDRSGVFWAGNYRAGLNRFIRRQSQFAVLRMNTSVYSILEDTDGEVWIGSSSGLYRSSDPVSSAVRYARNSTPSLRPGDYGVKATIQDSAGFIWVGHAKGIDRYSKKENSMRRYPLAGFQPPPFEGKMVKSLCCDREGDVWVGVDQGTVVRYNREKDKFEPFEPRQYDAVDPKMPSVWSIYAGHDGKVWFASFGAGLYSLDKHASTLRQYLSVPGDSTSPSFNALYFVRESSDGSMWLGTFGRGVDRLDRGTHRFENHSVADGLLDNFVKGMLEDRRGNLWFSTDKGLTRFDPVSHSFKSYRERDGLHANVFLSGAYEKGASGRFYFGGENGVTMFHPDSLTENVFAPQVIISSLRVFDKAVAPLGGLRNSSSETLRLAYDENFFSFEFVSLDFTVPENNRYAYMLEGLDKDWIDAGARRYASYTHVPSGQYVFRVKGTNSDGVWSPHVAALKVIVAPPFWETWWFRIAAVLALFGIGAAAYNYRVNRLLEIERLRVRIASDLHDDIGSSLTKISLQSELIQEGFDPGEQQNYLKNIAAMSRELVTSMSDIVWSIDARNDSMGNLFDKMHSFGVSVLSPRDVQFHFAYSGCDRGKKLPVDVRENLYLIFKEAINNIAKHACAHAVNVVLRNDSDKFSMIIIDDGRGWEGTERPGGHGARNMQMRAKRLGGRIEFTKDEGTRVILTMKRI